MKGVPSFRLHEVTDWSLKVQYRLQTSKVLMDMLMANLWGKPLLLWRKIWLIRGPVGSLTHLSLWKSLSFSIQGKKSLNAHYEKWKAREEGKQYVPYSHMMVGVYSLWKTSDGFLQLRKQLTAKKKQPPSRAMDEPDLRPLRARCLHWSTSLGEDGL